jgi:SAM-dependent methyltransferase
MVMTFSRLREKLLPIASGNLHRLRTSLGHRYYHELDLPYRAVDRIIEDAGGQEWFTWSIRNRTSRGEAVAAMDWIISNLDRNTPVFETGCGCAANLIWLGQHGFTSLAGRDASTEAIAAGARLADLAGLRIDLAVDDGLAPRLPIPKAGLLLALNWLYYQPQFELLDFLRSYRHALMPGGVVVFDMVDTAFNHMPGNQDLTDDWRLPQKQRRPTQYKIRRTREEISEAASSGGFEVISTLSGTDVPPRLVWVLRSPGSDN